MKTQLNLKEMNKLDLAINPNTPAESLAELAKDENWIVRNNAESNQNTPKNQAGGNVLLIGKTKFDNVDWNNTLKLWYQFSRMYDGYDENEINIIDSDEIFDIKTKKI